jgi:hypothetical protein
MLFVILFTIKNKIFPDKSNTRIDLIELSSATLILIFPSFIGLGEIVKCSNDLGSFNDKNEFVYNSVLNAINWTLYLI